MGKKMIIEIEIVKRETLIISQPRFAARPSCGDCGADAMVTPEEAAAITKINLRTIFRLVETGEIHFAENASGAFYICADSLARRKHLNGIFNDAEARTE